MATFTAAGVSAATFVKAGTKFRILTSGTWVATVDVEESFNGGLSYKRVATFQTNQSTDYDAKAADRMMRLNCVSYTSGTLTYTNSTAGVVSARTKYTSVPIGSVAYGSFGTDTTPSATTLYLIEVFVGEQFTATGIGSLNGTAAATDKYIFELRDTSGKLLANTAVAGVTASGTDAFQQIAFAAPITLAPGRYWIGQYANGTTTRMRTVATATFVNVLAGSITGQTFGTILDSVPPPTTFTADKGPISYLY